MNSNKGVCILASGNLETDGSLKTYQFMFPSKGDGPARKKMLFEHTFDTFLKHHPTALLHGLRLFEIPELWGPKHDPIWGMQLDYEEGEEKR